MAYEVVLSEKAIRSLNALEEPLRSFVEARLSLLGEPSFSLSSRSADFWEKSICHRFSHATDFRTKKTVFLKLGPKLLIERPPGLDYLENM